MSAKGQWLQISEQRFKGLSSGERILLRDIGGGKHCIFDSTAPEEDRILRGSLLAWVLTSQHAFESISHRGVEVSFAVIEGDIRLDFAMIDFPIRLLSCQIRGTLSMTNAQTRSLILSGTTITPHMGKKAISAHGAEILGAVLLNERFKADGEVDFDWTRINREFNCAESSFTSEKEFAISAYGAEVEGNFDLTKCSIKGMLRLTALIAKRSLVLGSRVDPLDEGRDRPPLPPVELKIPIFYLSDAKVGTLNDTEEFWSFCDRVTLTGFEYGMIYRKSPFDCTTRLYWIRKQYADEKAHPLLERRLSSLPASFSKERNFLPQPYEQLASVLKKMGHERNSTRILIEKNNDRLRTLPLFGKTALGLMILGMTCGYGYRPSNAVKCSVSWILGFGLLLLCYPSVAFTASIVPPPSEFWCGLVSTFFPFLKSVDATAWNLTPEGNILMMVHAGVGVLLTTLWLGGVTGVIRK